MRTLGGRVACGGSKCSSIASLRLARASSSVSPWLATSSSRHWDTYQLPSRQTVAANGRVIFSLFHRHVCLRRRSAPEGSEPKLGRRKVSCVPLHPPATRTKIRGVAGFLEPDSTGQASGEIPI